MLSRSGSSQITPPLGRAVHVEVQAPSLLTGPLLRSTKPRIPKVAPTRRTACQSALSASGLESTQAVLLAAGILLGSTTTLLLRRVGLTQPAPWELQPKSLITQQFADQSGAKSSTGRAEQGKAETLPSLPSQIAEQESDTAPARRPWPDASAHASKDQLAAGNHGPLGKLQQQASNLEPGDDTRTEAPCSAAATEVDEAQQRLRQTRTQLTSSEADEADLRSSAAMEVAQAHEQLELAQGQLDHGRDAAAESSSNDPSAAKDLPDPDQATLDDVPWHQDLASIRDAEAEGASMALVRSELEAARAEQEMLQRALSTAQADAQAAMRKLQAEREEAATTESARAAAAKDVTNVLAQLRTMRFEREEEQEWLRELQQSLAHAEARAASQEARASSLEAAAQASSSALQQLEARAAELQEQLLLQRGRSRWLWRKLQPVEAGSRLSEDDAAGAELQAVKQQLWQQTRHTASLQEQAVKQQLWQQTRHTASLQEQVQAVLAAQAGWNRAQEHAQAGRDPAFEEADTSQPKRAVTMEAAREAASSVLFPSNASGDDGITDVGGAAETPLDQLEIQLAQRRAAEARAEAAMLVETIEERALEAITNAEEEKKAQASKAKQADRRADEARAQAALLVETIEEQAQEASMPIHLE
ncbi:hypothetical protein WJX84_004865 [Apatococcus fuscideae]|uniref:Uncharacterized protein n=1 Tax=Apatococcus fuscideae TaxID=2026836 RepID=A0AAW1T1C5_9CHLO